MGKTNRNIINLEKVTALLGENKTRIGDYLKFVKEGIKLDLDEYNPFLNKKEVYGSKTFAAYNKTEMF